MLGTAKNCDIIFLQMRNYVPDMDNSMKKEYLNLLKQLESILVESKSLKNDINSFLPNVFNFRVKAIKWLFEEFDLALTDMIDDAYHKFEEIQNDSKLQTLVENILFALRCNKRVVNSLIVNSEAFNDENISKSVNNLPTINYEQFLSSLAFIMPDDETAQKFLEWINASLCIETITVSAILINEKKLKISTKSIDELAFIIADSAQEYSAIAFEMGILNHNESNKTKSNQDFDKEYLKEQKYIANLGITDFAEKIY